MTEPRGGDATESDERIVESVRLGEASRFAILVQRYNRHLYRVARSIVRDEHEAEDVVQQAHVSAYMHLHQFEGRAKFSTWLARIAAHEALSRLRLRQRTSSAAFDETAGEAATPARDTPEEALSRSELARAVESAIDELPHPYRSAFVLRHVEGLETREAARALGVSEANFRVLVHRARGLLQAHILAHVQTTADELFAFGGERCARVTRGVLRQVLAHAAAERALGAPVS